nr:sigma-70 family RNA polymerase sigma factor [Pseudonocardia acidicola]
MVEHRAGSGSGDPGDPEGPGEPAASDMTVEEQVEGEPTADEEPAADDEERAAVVQDGPGPSPAELRVDFGAHLEANYQRLVGQLYAITLDSGEAHDVVQDAYSRAWREWSEIGSSADSTAWIRRVAVRSTMRSWRSVLSRIGIGRPRPPAGEAVDPRTAALLAALSRLDAAERRSVVLFHMVGMPLHEIAALEHVSPGTVQARVSRARNVVTEGLADVLPAVLGGYEEDYR